MTNARQDAFYLVVLGSVFFALVGFATQRLSYLGMIDFKEFYSCALCLIEHHDPYNENDLAAVYKEQAAVLPSVPVTAHWQLTDASLSPNFPTTFLLMAPFALLPWKLAAIIWTLLTAASFILAAFLMADLGAQFAPRLSSLLIVLLLINSEMLLALGNTAGLVVGLCVIAAWCFLRERFVVAGILCMAVSLAIKPHVAGLIWLYFLLAGGVRRKRALETLAVTALVAVAAILWIGSVAPHWPAELHSNLATITARGGLDDPGPSSGGAFGVNMIVCLQAIISRFRDEPGFYNPIAYLIVAALLVPWLIKTLRTRFSPALEQNPNSRAQAEGPQGGFFFGKKPLGGRATGYSYSGSAVAWFALAAVVPLAMLPTYHRCYDARLLMLTVPACAMLWKMGGPARWCALLLTVAAIVVTGDILWIVVFHFTGYSYRSALMGMIPAPLVLLSTGMFYLWVYLRVRPAPAPTAVAAGH